MKNIVTLFLLACIGTSVLAQNTTNFAHIGRIDRFEPEVNELIPKDAKIEVLCGGFEWSEGPVWMPESGNKYGGFVLFSDIPNNVVMKWQEGVGASVYMKPAGYTGVADYGREPGSNGLALDAKGRLVMCEHGDRRISVVTNGGGKITLADHWQGKRLNSPNDLWPDKAGGIYFTDPRYGDMEGLEQPGFHVYYIDPKGRVTRIISDLVKPNGILGTCLLYTSDAADE